MTKISNERLDELIAKNEKHIRNEHEWDELFALRELRDYRKAVREYLKAVDNQYGSVRTEERAEANLRALQESDDG